MKLAGDNPGNRIGREEPKRVVALVLRSHATVDFSEEGSVWKWANDTADAVLVALRNNGDLA